jgi:hypothetical protein
MQSFIQKPKEEGSVFCKFDKRNFDLITLFIVG